MKNLGKILFIFLLPIYLFASINATVSSTDVTKGEVVTLNLNITGEDIKQPNIDSICGYDVLSTSSQTNITMVNGDYKKKYILSYNFMPLSSCTIKPIKVKVGSKEFITKSINIKVGEQKVDKNSDFILSLIPEKKDLFVGESFKVDLVFKQKQGAGAVDSRFEEPKFNGFWVKKQSKQITYKDGNYNVIKITYTLSAQREGKLSILPAKISIAKRVNTQDAWGMFIQNVKWKTYFSNSIDVDVKPLPEGVKYIGDFTISAKVDKTTIKQNEALNLLLTIKGDGNLEDMQGFKPSIDGVTVYDEKISIQDGKLTQKMAFISDKDFTIPPFILKYFDIKTKKIKTISTKDIKVKLVQTKVNKPLIVKKEDRSEKVQKQNISQTDGISMIYAVGIFFIGIIVGIVLMLSKPWSFSKTQNKVNIKDEKLLFVKLLPYKEDTRVQNILDILEKNIYSSQKQKIDKKILKEILKEYNI